MTINHFLMILVMFCALPLGLGCSTASDDGRSISHAQSSSETAKAPTINLEVGDLEKLDSWELTAYAKAQLTTNLAEAMAEVTDTDSVPAAIQKFKQLAKQFAAVDRARDSLGDVSDSDKSVSLVLLKSANEKFNVAYKKLKENESLFELVEQAIDQAYMGEE